MGGGDSGGGTVVPVIAPTSKLTNRSAVQLWGVGAAFAATSERQFFHEDQRDKSGEKKDRGRREHPTEHVREIRSERARPGEKGFDM